MNRSLRHVLAPLALVAAPFAAHAQLIDDVDFRREGANAVMQVRFVTPVQYRRALTAASGDAVQAFYDVVSGTDLPRMVGSERRIPANGTLPEIIVTDDSAGRDSLRRRLVVKFAKPIAFRVRAGRGDRTIELVLVGQGRALTDATSIIAQPQTPTGRFQITLAQSSDADVNLDTPVPSSLQTYQVFTGDRVIDGKTVHEISIGYFETLVEAEGARQALLRRFPQAAIVALVPKAAVPAVPVVPPVPTVPAVPPAPTVPAVPVAPVAAAPAAPAPSPVAPVAAAPLPTAAEVNAQGAELLAAAKAADARQDSALALEKLNQLLNLPANAATREGQELVGNVRLKAGDNLRARAEFETFLQLFPTGPDADRVRIALSNLPKAVPAARPRPTVEPTSTLTGSISEFFYGGASKVRTQDFQDSPISGLPELASDNTLAGTDQKQFLTNVDVNWRYRDADTDMRFVFRDAYTKDQLNSDKDRNRLSALYFEHRSLTLGTGIKLGRQSPTGGGVLGRFDGVQGSYTVVPKWRVNAAVGIPTDKLLDAKRHFYGAWVDADALTSNLSGSLYLNQQVIDGETDRRALGAELRYFNGGVSVSGVLDYDQLIKGLNIASLQGTWQLQDNTVFNVLYDQRATPLYMLGNALFFGTSIPAPTATDPLATRLATSIKDLLANSTLTTQSLRDSVKATTTKTTQGLIGVTTPINKNWQVGGDLRVTNLGEIPPIPDILPNGQGRSDNQSVGAQLIGTNLYSSRDTHVISLSVLKGSSESLDPLLGTTVLSYSGQLLSYNNSSQLNEYLLFEPSLKFYFQKDSSGVKTARVGPGLRVTYRVAKQVALESEISGEHSKVTSPSRNETSNRVFYYLGGRYDF